MVERLLPLGLLSEAEFDSMTDQIAVGSASEGSFLEELFDKLKVKDADEARLILDVLKEMDSDEAPVAASASESRCPCCAAEDPDEEPDEEPEEEHRQLAVCRMCLAEAPVEALCAPCECKGSAEYVHPQCLVRWQQRGHLSECEVCSAPWLVGLDASTKPVNSAVESEMLISCEAAIASNDPRALRRWLSPYVVSEHGESLCVRAVLGERAAALAALLSAGCDPNALVDMGRPLLTSAVLAGSLECARTLLRASADVNLGGAIGRATSLHAAASLPAEVPHALPAMRLLLEAGARLDARVESRTGEPEGATPVYVAAWHGCAANLELLLDAAMRGNAKEGGTRRQLDAAQIDALEAGAALVDVYQKKDLGCLKALTSAGVALPWRTAQQTFFFPAGNSPLRRLGFDDVGSSSRLLAAVLIGELEVLRFLIACGIDVNDSQHRYSARQISPLSMAIMYTPEKSRATVMTLLLEAKADVDYCDDRASPLITALWEHRSDEMRMLLSAGARTSVTNPHSGATAITAASAPNSKCTRPLYHALLSYMLTGITGHVDDFGKVECAHVRVESAHRARAEAAGLSGAEWRERGNAHMGEKRYLLAVDAYSTALVAPSPDPEPHKALANRSLAHLRLAQAHAEGAGAVAPPHLMEVLSWDGTVHRVDEAIDCGRISTSQGCRVLAFADAKRASLLAPRWAKAHGRLAEAAYELALACLRVGEDDECEMATHGIEVMRIICVSSYQQAAALDRAGDWMKRSMRAEKELSFIEIYKEKDEPGPAEQLRSFLAVLQAKAGITKAELKAAGFSPPPKVFHDDRMAEAAFEQLDAAIESSATLRRKSDRLKHGGRDRPATIADAIAITPSPNADEWWSMSYMTVGRSESGVRRWAMSVSDQTEWPHPHSQKILWSCVHESDEHPPLDECEAALIAAIAHPMPGAGPPRRPGSLVIAWRMRAHFKGMRRVTAKLGIQLTIESKEVAIGIAEAHGTDIEGFNH